MKKVLLTIIIFTLSLFGEELSLEDSLKYALEHSPKMLAVKEKARTAQGTLTAANALLWPQITATGIYNRSSYLTNIELGSPMQIPVLGPTGIPTGDTVPTSSFSISSDRLGDSIVAKLGLAWPIFTWGKLNGTAEIADYGKKIADEDIIKTTNDLDFEVKSAFYGLLLSEKLVKVLEETKKSLDVHVDAVQKRYAEGLASKFELLRSKVQLANVEPQLTRARDGYNIAILNFNNTLGAETNTKYTAKGDFKYEKMEFNIEDCLKKAFERRSEVKQAELRIKTSESALNIAAAYYRPSLILTADYLANMGQQMPPNDKEWTYGWDAGAVLSIPIFDAFMTSGKYEEADGNMKQAVIGKKQLMDGISIEVRSALMILESSEKTMVTQEENVKMAEESNKMVKERYAEGLATNLEVLDTEVSSLEAETSYLQSIYDSVMAKETLLKATETNGGENVKK